MLKLFLHRVLFQLVRLREIILFKRVYGHQICMAQLTSSRQCFNLHGARAYTRTWLLFHEYAHVRAQAYACLNTAFKTK